MEQVAAERTAQHRRRRWLGLRRRVHGPPLGSLNETLTLRTPCFGLDLDKRPRRYHHQPVATAPADALQQANRGVDAKTGQRLLRAVPNFSRVAVTKPGGGRPTNPHLKNLGSGPRFQQSRLLHRGGRAAFEDCPSDRTGRSTPIGNKSIAEVAGGGPPRRWRTRGQWTARQSQGGIRCGTKRRWLCGLKRTG
jgi:hypothetical protein